MYIEPKGFLSFTATSESSLPYTLDLAILYNKLGYGKFCKKVLGSCKDLAERISKDKK